MIHNPLENLKRDLKFDIISHNVCLINYDLLV